MDEKKQRHEWAVQQMGAGMGLSELTAFTEMGVLPIPESRCCRCKSHKDWLDACYGSEIDQRDWALSSLWESRRSIARKAENAETVFV